MASSPPPPPPPPRRDPAGKILPLPTTRFCREFQMGSMGARSPLSSTEAGPAGTPSASRPVIRRMDWDTQSRNHVEPPPPLTDCIVHNKDLKRPMLPGLAEARKELDKKRQRGQVSDLHAIIIPVEIKGLLVEKFKLKKHTNKRSDNGETQPKLCIPLRTTKCCEFFVQLRWFDDHLVIFKGWEDFAKEIKLDVGDVLVLKFDGDDFKVKLFRFINSTQEPFFCPVHGR